MARIEKLMAEAESITIGQTDDEISLTFVRTLGRRKGP